MVAGGPMVAGRINGDAGSLPGFRTPPAAVAADRGWPELRLATRAGRAAGPRSRARRHSRRARAVKRGTDLAGGLVLLLAALPVVLVAACAIKLGSKGPVFYRQRRLGIHGAEFTMLKLRSMYDGSDRARDDLLGRNEQDGGGVLFKLRHDPRVTRVGTVIRRFSIDELPQLVHVLSGRMSLVGPRPLAAADSGYDGAARRRLLVRPGLTGLWQVSGRSRLSWDDAVRLDLYYVENWSLGLDIAIMCRTIIAVLTRWGAY
jgi:lipopolysaccharide/colanic/teichoic acid biosynthesis glycosyltransferase